MNATNVNRNTSKKKQQAQAKAVRIRSAAPPSSARSAPRGASASA